MEKHHDQQNEFVEDSSKSKVKADDTDVISKKEDDAADRKLSTRAKLWMIVKFVLPLIFALMVPSISEQILNRSITSIAKERMAEPLASFGLAYYIARLFTTVAIELRHIGVALVDNKQDNRRMTKLSVVVGVVLSSLFLILGLTPASDWLIQVVHRQSREVTDMTVSVMLYLSPLPLLEAIASYYEGVLVHQKLTTLTGGARLTDCVIQVVIVLLCVLTPIHTHIQPVLVPVIAMCTAVVLRLTLMIVFWFVAVRQKLPEEPPTCQVEQYNELTIKRALLFWFVAVRQRLPEEPPTCQVEQYKELTIKRALLFWFPLVVVRVLQIISLPVVNLVVSRVVSEREGVHAAAQTAAVLTVVYPLVRLLHTYLNDIRSVVPVFRQKTDNHDRFSFKVLGLFSGLFILFAFTLNVILLKIPQVAYFIMNTIMGLNDELSTLSLLPLRVYCLIAIPAGIRAYCTGILITWRKTEYLTPGAVIGMVGVIVGLVALPYTQIRGDVMGVLCLLISYLLEMFGAILAVVWLWHHRRENGQN